MQSLLMNCDKDSTFIVYHLLCTSDFNKLSIIIFKSLFIRFPHNLELIFYNMGNIFLHYKKIYKHSVTYFRLLTPLFINEERLIHLDADCLVFCDLKERPYVGWNASSATAVTTWAVEEQKPSISPILMVRRNFARSMQNITQGM